MSSVGGLVYRGSLNELVPLPTPETLIEQAVVAQGYTVANPAPTASGIDCQAGDLLLAIVATRWTFASGVAVSFNNATTTGGSDCTEVYRGASGHTHIWAKQATGSETSFYVNRSSATSWEWVGYLVIRLRNVDIAAGVSPAYQSITEKLDSDPETSPVSCGGVTLTGGVLPAIAVHFAMQELGSSISAPTWTGTNIARIGSAQDHGTLAGQVNAATRIMTNSTTVDAASFGFSGNFDCAGLYGTLVWNQGEPNNQPPGEQEIIFSDGFEVVSPNWWAPWSVPPSEEYKLSTCTVTDLPANGVTPINNKMVSIIIPAGEHKGVGILKYDVSEYFGYYPDELWLRWDMCFGTDWQSIPYTSDARGKLPGVDNRGVTGGGVPSDGTNGWSLRGRFDENNDGGRTCAIGTYAYHADQPTNYGEPFMWGGAAAALARGTWYEIGLHVRVNDVGSANGVLTAWVDGTQVYSKTNLRLRTVAGWGIRNAPAVDVYYGGTPVSPQDRHVCFDNFEVSTSNLFA